MVPTSTIKNFLIYSFGSFLLRGISYLSAPIALYYVSPAEFGLLSLLTSFGTVCTIFFGLGLRQLLTIEFFHLHKEERIRFISELIFFYCSVTIPILLIFLFNLKWCKLIFFSADTPNRYLAVVFFNCFLFFFVELLYQLLRFQEKAKALVIIQLSGAILCFGTTFIGLLFLQLGIEAMLLGQLISLSGTTLLGSFFFFQRKIYRVLEPYRALCNTWSQLPKSIIFMPGLLFTWIISGADRWLLAHFLDLEAVGIYTLASTVAQLFYFLILVPMGNSYIPFMLKQFTQNKERIIYFEQLNRKNMWHALAICLLLISIGSFLLIMANPLLPKAYHPSLSYVFPLLLSQLFILGVYFANCLLQFSKCTNFLALSILIPAIINCSLNWLLIPVFGIAGCVGATVFANGVYFAITVLYNHYILHKKSSLQEQGAFIKGYYRINQSKENPPLTQRPHSEIAHGRHLDLQQEELTEQLDSHD